MAFVWVSSRFFAEVVSQAQIKMLDDTHFFLLASISHTYFDYMNLQYMQIR